MQRSQRLRGEKGLIGGLGDKMLSGVGRRHRKDACRLRIIIRRIVWGRVDLRVGSDDYLFGWLG